MYVFLFECMCVCMYACLCVSLYACNFPEFCLNALNLCLHLSTFILEPLRLNLLWTFLRQSCFLKASYDRQWKNNMRWKRISTNKKNFSKKCLSAEETKLIFLFLFTFSCFDCWIFLMCNVCRWLIDLWWSSHDVLIYRIRCDVSLMSFGTANTWESWWEKCSKIKHH